jgi:octaprenyl-diphosphate synthase
MMVGTQDLRVLDVMAEATNIIAEGEVLQLLNIGNTDVDEDAYLRVIQYKTAKLFEAAGRVGAMLAKATPEQEAALAAYGMHLGTAFQIIDDVLDYSGDAATIGKSLGDDLAEGKPTLPLIYVMRHGEAADAECVRHALSHADREHFAAVLAAVQRSGALDYAREQARLAAERAVSALDAIPDSDTRTAMIELARLSVAREA